MAGELRSRLFMGELSGVALAALFFGDGDALGDLETLDLDLLTGDLFTVCLDAAFPFTTFGFFGDTSFSFLGDLVLRVTKSVSFL